MSARLRPVPIAFVLLALIALTIGCEDLPGENVEGVVRAPAPMLVPATKQPVCIGFLELEVRHRNGSRTNTRYHRSTAAFAASASLEVSDGTQLKIVGTSDRVRLAQSTSVWKWVKEDGGKPPAALYGRGLDDELDVTQDPKIINGPISVEAREYFAECGAKVVLRGLQKGGELRLVETNAVESSNVFTFFGVMFGAFFLFLVVPIVVVIILIIRRSKKKA